MRPCTDQNLDHSRKSYIWRKWPDAPQKGQMRSYSPSTLYTDMEQRHYRACNQPEPAVEKMKKIQDQELGNTKDVESQHLPDSSEHRDQEDSKILLSNTVQAHWELQHYPDIRAAMAPGNRKMSTAISVHLSTALMFISFASQRYDSSAVSQRTLPQCPSKTQTLEQLPTVHRRFRSCSVH